MKKNYIVTILFNIILVLLKHQLQNYSKKYNLGFIITVYIIDYVMSILYSIKVLTIIVNKR